MKGTQLNEALVFLSSRVATGRSYEGQNRFEFEATTCEIGPIIVDAQYLQKFGNFWRLYHLYPKWSKFIASYFGSIFIIFRNALSEKLRIALNRNHAELFDSRDLHLASFYVEYKSRIVKMATLILTNFVDYFTYFCSWKQNNWNLKSHRFSMENS